MELGINLKQRNGLIPKLGIVFILFVATINCFPQTDTLYLHSARLIGHRGGCNGLFPENSLSSIHESLDFFDGVEVDVFMSHENTLWLSHGQYLPDCNNKKWNIHKLNDSLIIKLNNGGGQSHDYTKLDNVFSFIAKNHPDKCLSLDVKAWKPSNFATLLTFPIYKKMAIKIDSLYRMYPFCQLLIESHSFYFLNKIKQLNPDIKVCYISFRNHRKAIRISMRKGYKAVSLKYLNKNNDFYNLIPFIKKNNIIVQAWTLNDKNEILKADSLGIQYIQTDSRFIIKRKKE